MDITTLTRSRIDSVSDLMTWGNHLQGLNRAFGPMLFRGQAEPFQNLTPTLARAIQNAVSSINYGAVIHLEEKLLNGFINRYSQIHNPSQGLSMSQNLAQMPKLEVLSFMQHYEVPTRLLDWTEDVWTAAFFACASSPDKDAELWYFDESILNVTPHTVPIATVQKIVENSIGAYPPKINHQWNMQYITVINSVESPRLTAQRGRLTACGDAQADHANLLQNLADKKQGGSPTDLFGRYLIRSDKKSYILKYLDEVKNISAKTLFPDIVGLQRYLRWEFESLRTQLLQVNR